MYGALSGTLGDVIKSFHLGDVKIDNWMFRLHYVISVVIFVGYSLIVTMNTYVGDPIDCKHHGNEDWGDYLDWFCYIHGTESLKYPKREMLMIPLVSLTVLTKKERKRRNKLHRNTSALHVGSHGCFDSGRDFISAPVPVV
eukprot:TRINITY_DN12675_c0_g1_i1.p1 TRINITY_DN12675_c0_g1~~TRINITY_DN12675_c0_g1_i1.p1  ORF type:complete len:141 (-),score=10.42 TRINITY_DN12675_c0_g1_i1:53-475(-)